MAQLTIAGVEHSISSPTGDKEAGKKQKKKKPRRRVMVERTSDFLSIIPGLNPVSTRGQLPASSTGFRETESSLSKQLGSGTLEESNTAVLKVLSGPKVLA